jgi:hypothetical protein
MIKRVFIDSDVILDVALAREPFVEASSLVLAILELVDGFGWHPLGEVGDFPSW